MYASTSTRRILPPGPSSKSTKPLQPHQRRRARCQARRRMKAFHKKAHELKKVCGAEVFTVIERRGRFHTFSSTAQATWPPPFAWFVRGRSCIQLEKSDGLLTLTVGQMDGTIPAQTETPSTLGVRPKRSESPSTDALEGAYRKEGGCILTTEPGEAGRVASGGSGVAQVAQAQLGPVPVLPLGQVRLERLQPRAYAHL